MAFTLINDRTQAVIASRLGLLTAVRMRRLPDPKPASSAEGVALG